jgi:maltose alpha-D-glucosyltransferase/alpha-amylase
VNNLSRFAQPVELDLRRHAGAVPVELVGKVRFPRITDAPYVLTLAPHGFYWLSIEDVPE